MRKFFLHDGNEQIGPFEIDELKKKNITKDTNVWADGMESWDKAGNIEELKNIFVSSPPPFIKTPPQIDKKVLENKESTSLPVNKLSKRKSPLIWIIGCVIIIGVGFLFFVNQNSHSGGRFENSSFESPPPPIEKTPEELRQELLLKEQNSPSVYLVNEGTWRENIFGTTVLEGTISNTATLANFKDVVLEVTWLTKTNTEIKKSRYSVFEYVGAGKTIKYKLKVDAPSSTGGVSILVDSAVPVE